MDREPSANEDRATGASDFSDAEDEQARRAAEKDRRDRSHEQNDAAAAPSVIAPPD